MRPHPRRAEVDPQKPRAWGTSDRNGHIGNLHKFQWQFEWRGTHLINTRAYIHEDELDIPQRQLGTLIIPPDPIPLINARPENYAIDEQPVSTRYTISPTGQPQSIRVIVTPPGQAMLSNRIVTTPGGVPYLGQINVNGNAPVILSINPSFALPGTAITITGRNFSLGVFSVTIGGIEVSFTVISDTKIIAIAP